MRIAGDARSCARGGAVRTRAACTSSVAPRARGGGRLGAAALAQRGELGGACEGRRLRRGCARGAGACVGDARAPAGGCRAGAWGSGPLRRGTLAQEWACAPAGKAKRVASAARPAPTPPPAPHARPRADPSRRTPTPRRSLAPHARLRADPPCVFNAPLLPKTRLRALFGRQFRILDHSSRSQRAFSPKASVSFRRAVIAVRGLDFGRSGRAVSHEAFVGAPEGPAGSFGALRAVPFAASSL